MGKRENTGSVAGGMAGRQLPPGLDVGDWSGHAEGRLNAMAEIAVNALFLKSRGFASVVSGYRGAAYQDFRGDDETIHRIVGAHRALFALHLNGTNMAQLPEVKKRAGLAKQLIAPQARTDMLPKPANDADSRLETAVNSTVYTCLEHAFYAQATGQPVDLDLAIIVIRRTRQMIVRGFDIAHARFHALQEERGWKKGVVAGSFMPSDEEVDDFFDNMSETSISVYRSRKPTDYYSLIELALDMGQQETWAAAARLSTRHALQHHVAQLEALTP